MPGRSRRAKRGIDVFHIAMMVYPRISDTILGVCSLVGHAEPSVRYGMPAPKTVWTAEMARALPDDGKRYEVLDGELLVGPAPSWRHQTVLLRLYKLVDRYVEKHSLGWTRVSPGDIEFSPRHWVQPDLFVVPEEGAGEPESWKDVKRLLLAAEVLSKSTANTDRLKKRPNYQKFGVAEYWIVDVDSRLVERWRPTDARPEIIADTLEWGPKPEIEPLRIELAEVFGHG